MTLVGLILDGGSGNRLGGVRKGGVRLGNLDLAEHVAHRLRPQCDYLLYSCGPTSTPARVPSGIDILPDLTAGPKGPVAGLYAAVERCADHKGDSLLVLVSVDTPFFPADFVARAKELLSSRINCVIAGYADRTYPTVGLWRLAPLGPVVRGADDGAKGPRMRAVAETVGYGVLDYTNLSAENPFDGANTVTDLLALQSRLARKGEHDPRL